MPKFNVNGTSYSYTRFYTCPLPSENSEAIIVNCYLMLAFLYEKQHEREFILNAGQLRPSVRPSQILLLFTWKTLLSMNPAIPKQFNITFHLQVAINH